MMPILPSSILNLSRIRPKNRVEFSLGPCNAMDVHDIKEWVFGLFGIILFFVFIAWFGDLFRAHTTLFFALWLAIPVFAWTLTSTSALDTFHGKALHHVRTWLMILICLISFGFFACYEQVRDHFGKRHIA